jgi:hypothetical protein
VAGGTSASFSPQTGAAPRFVRLARQGDLFIGEVSSDGLTWLELGRVSIPMHPNTIRGLAVTSHDNLTLATAIFDEVLLANQ